jgi:hypothetical protein
LLLPARERLDRLLLARVCGTMERAVDEGPARVLAQAWEEKPPNLVELGRAVRR